ncbi:hypothetical protein HYT84_03515 [Candidatus Micrarchaeota archaeon]|nr:hypothetical protein [Candidatus Micrarchaeota archaeon]
MIHIHAKPKKVGNSWAILIPKEQADELNLNSEANLSVDIDLIPKLNEIFGTWKSKKSTEQLMREIDEGWD